MKGGSDKFVQKSFHLLASFKEVLGRKVSELPGKFEKDDWLADTGMDLETNVSKDFAGDNSLVLKCGAASRNAVIKIAQTFRNGTNDIDALAFVRMYLRDESQHHANLHDFKDLYVLANFRPVVTKKNWRVNCGVAGYDKRLGLPPFFPTRLRFDDFIYRLWIQQPGIVSAHVDSARTHIKTNYMRNPLAMDAFNEEICTLLKKKIKARVTRLEELTIRFSYNGEVTLKDTEEILEKITGVHRQVSEAAARTRNARRRKSLGLFAENLARSFYSFEPDFCQQNVTRIVDDFASMVQASLELWPTLVEICDHHQDKKDFPQLRVKNKKLNIRDNRAVAF